MLGDSYSTFGSGVSGWALASSGPTIGVFGRTNSADVNAYGVYSYGRMGGSGTKSFRIDHPFDPQNKYLLHYCSEGPEPLNVYAGNVTTDQNGKAWVHLPDYFGEINKEPKYSLTVIDDSEGPGFVQVKIAKKIRNNRFEIMTSAPRVEVSWRVEAVRNDRWVQKYGAPVEQDKPDHECGTYQHPELYGAPKELGTNYRFEKHQPK